MTSTLHNLDLEEMTRCLGHAIKRHIDFSVNMMKSANCSLTSMPDFLDEEAKQQIYLLNEGASTQIVADNISEIPPMMSKMFDQAFNDPKTPPGSTPDSTAIYNYVKNIILRTRMEREVAVISLAYVERLILRTGLRINEINWKRLLFTCLILASKIWDDDSFENNDFAQAFTLYSLKEIGYMESTFLQLIDFSVTISSADYARYYFILRTFSSEKEKSYAL